MHLSMFLGPIVFGPQMDKPVIDAGIEQALEADDAGFAAIYVGEQHNNNYEPYSNPFMMGSYLAGQLQQAWIGTSVVPLILHHPMFLVERFNLLDQLTEGKVMFGISAGRPGDGKTFGVDALSAAERQRLFEQRLDVMRRAWAYDPTDGPFTFATDREEGVMEGRVMPYSYRADHPLFAVSTNTPAKALQAGTDGHYLHLGPINLDGAVEMAGLYREGLAASGADEAAMAARLRWLFSTKWIYTAETEEEVWEGAEQLWSFGLRALPWLQQEGYEGMSVREMYTCDPGPFAPAPGMPESPAAWLQRGMICGTPDQVAAELQRWEAAGLAHVHTRFLMNGMQIDRCARSWRLFVDAVVPQLDLRPIPGPTAEEVRPMYRDTSPEPVA